MKLKGFSKYPLIGIMSSGMFFADFQAEAAVPAPVQNICKTLKIGFCAGEDTKASPEEETKKAREFTESEKQTLTQLLEQQQRLKAKESELDQREAQLKTLQEDVQGQISQLEKLQKEVQRDIEAKKVQDAAQLDKTVTFYAKMDPEKAARSLEQLNSKIAVQILMKIKDKQASAILASMKAEQAARLVEEIARKR